MTDPTPEIVNVLRDLIDKWQTRNGDSRSTLVGGGRTDCIRDLTSVLRTQYAAEPWSYAVQLHTPVGTRWLGPPAQGRSEFSLVETIFEARLWSSRLEAEPFREQADRAYPASITTTT